MAIFVPRFVRQLRDVLLTAPADGEVLTYDSADAKWKNEAGGGGGGAPTTADYLVGTAQAGLSAEIVAGTSPGGELGGTWSAPTVDTTHSGSSHAATQAAAEAASVILAPASFARNVIQPTALATGLTLVPFDNNESFTDTPAISVPFAGNPAASALAFKLFTDPVVNNFEDAAANLIEGYFQLATTISGSGGAQAAAILHGAGSLTLSGTPVGVPALRVRDSGFTTLFEIARTGWVMSREQADPAAPPANYGLIYVRDNGSGLTQWCVRFPTGAVYVLATEGDGAIYRAGGTDVALADGGTGSSTAAGARTNLGLVIGTDVQAFDTDLAQIAALVDPNADRLLFWDDSAGAWTHLTLGTNLSITGTTIDAAGGGGGSVATDAIWDTKGDLAVATGADTAVIVAIGANGTRPIADSAQSAGLAWTLPPGYGVAFAEATADIVVTSTTEATPDLILSLGAVTYTAVRHKFTFFSPVIRVTSTTAQVIQFWDDATLLFRVWQNNSDISSTFQGPAFTFFFTPTAASHTFKIMGFRSGGTSFTLDSDPSPWGTGLYAPIQFRAEIA